MISLLHLYLDPQASRLFTAIWDLGWDQLHTSEWVYKRISTDSKWVTPVPKQCREFQLDVNQAKRAVSLRNGTAFRPFVLISTLFHSKLEVAVGILGVGWYCLLMSFTRQA